jgi:hypothetical protein
MHATPGTSGNNAHACPLAPILPWTDGRRPSAAAEVMHARASAYLRPDEPWNALPPYFLVRLALLVSIHLLATGASRSSVLVR